MILLSAHPLHLGAVHSHFHEWKSVPSMLTLNVWHVLVFVVVCILMWLDEKRILQHRRVSSLECDWQLGEEGERERERIDKGSG